MKHGRARGCEFDAEGLVIDVGPSTTLAGDIVPALLTSELAVQTVIQQHLGLLWKAQNVKKHVSGPQADD